MKSPLIMYFLSVGFEPGFEGCWENWQHSILQLVTLETTLRMYWRDPRLRVDHLLNNSTSDYILLHPETSKFIWFPDIYIGKIFQFWKLSKNVSFLPLIKNEIFWVNFYPLWYLLLLIRNVFLFKICFYISGNLRYFWPRVWSSSAVLEVDKSLSLYFEQFCILKIH